MTANSTDTLIKINRDAMEQSSQQTVAQVLNARALGANLYINSNLAAGSQLNLTDQDDTVTITGNLISGTIENNGDYYSTLIDLKDGNDTLTVGGGKVMADPDSTGSSIQIQGGDGDKTVNFTNGLENDGIYFNLMTQGAGNHTINITGDFAAYGQGMNNANASNNISLSNYNNDINATDVVLNNDINISGNLIAQNNALNFLNDSGSIASNTSSHFYIAGDVIASYNGQNYIAQYSNNGSLIVDGSFIQNQASNTINHLTPAEQYTVNIGGDIYSDNMGSFTSFIMGKELSFEVGSIISDNKSNVNISMNSYISDKPGDIISSVVINGDIEALNASINSFQLYGPSLNYENAVSTFEVNGEVIARGSIEQDGYTYIPVNNISVMNSAMNLDTTLTFLNGFIADGGINNIQLSAGNDDLYIEGDLNAINGNNTADSLNELIGNNFSSSNTAGVNLFNLGEGDDVFTLIGDVTVSNGGLNVIYGGAGDDIISLKGHIDAGSLNVYGGDGDDTLILTATTQARFEADYKEWLTDLASSGNLADSGIETIRLDVRTLQTTKLGWLTDLIDQANADGAHITLEDRNGNVLVEPQLYLSFNTTSEANPIDALLDEYAAVVEQPVAPKAANVADVLHTFQVTEAHEFAVNFANNNYSQDLEQYATTAIVA